MEATCSSETSADLNGIHGVISQKAELFLTTDVRTSNPATWKKAVVLESGVLSYFLEVLRKPA
jgi:hypothetical protein